MSSTDTLAKAIVEGIQEVKGEKIVVADLRKIENSICQYMIICEGNSNTQVNAIATKMRETVLKNTKEKPLAMEGFENSEWIVADYGDIMVHIMQREPRAFYDLEHLWEDAQITEIPE